MTPSFKLGNQQYIIQAETAEEIQNGLLLSGTQAHITLPEKAQSYYRHGWQSFDGCSDKMLSWAKAGNFHHGFGYDERALSHRLEDNAVPLAVGHSVAMKIHYDLRPAA